MATDLLIGAACTVVRVEVNGHHRHQYWKL